MVIFRLSIPWLVLLLQLFYSFAQHSCIKGLYDCTSKLCRICQRDKRCLCGVCRVALVRRKLWENTTDRRNVHFCWYSCDRFSGIKRSRANSTAFFGIEGAPSDTGRCVLLAHAYESYSGQSSG